MARLPASASSYPLQRSPRPSFAIAAPRCSVFTRSSSRRSVWHRRFLGVQDIRRSETDFEHELSAFDACAAQVADRFRLSLAAPCIEPIDWMPDERLADRITHTV